MKNVRKQVPSLLLIIVLVGFPQISESIFTPATSFKFGSAGYRSDGAINHEFLFHRFCPRCFILG